MPRTSLKNTVWGIGIASVLAISPFAAQATTTINVAAAANLTGPLTDIINQFQTDYSTSGYTVSVTFGSSGLLESQINGTCSGCTPNAPGYDLFLAADVDHPNDLIANYPSTVYAYKGTPPAKYLIQYAIGYLDLWTNTVGVNVSSGLPAGWSKVAIADPSVAPYGVAAASVLKNSYGISSLPNAKVDEYSNITNTYNSINSGSELYGFIARSQICTHGDTTPVYSGVSHQDINSGGGTYKQIMQGGVEIARTRTSAQQTELTTFVQYITGKDFSNNTVTPNASNKLIYYCYTLPANFYP